MKKPYTVTGLDIGSSKIAGVTARVDRNGSFEVVAQASAPSKGVVRGMPVDLNAAVGSVAKVFDKLGAKMSKKLGEIYVNISGEDVKGSRSAGMIPLALRGREVVKPDIDRCINVASTIHLPFDREIIHRIVQDFSIDDQPWIKKPLGLYAARLACEVYVVTANINHIQSIYKCVNDAGYDAKGIVFTGMADGAALLEKEQKEEGVALVDMGSSITELSIFAGGSFAAFDIMPIGSQDSSGDFKENVAFRSLYTSIGARINEFSKAHGKIASIVLAGGMAFTDGIIEFLEEKLSYPIRMGIPKDVTGDVSGLDSVRLATAIGVAKHACEQKLADDLGIARRLSEKVVDLFNNYF